MLTIPSTCNGMVYFHRCWALVQVRFVKAIRLSDSTRDSEDSGQDYKQRAQRGPAAVLLPFQLIIAEEISQKCQSWNLPRLHLSIKLPSWIWHSIRRGIHSCNGSGPFLPPAACKRFRVLLLWSRPLVSGREGL
jgi:hypothetical protein